MEIAALAAAAAAASPEPSQGVSNPIENEDGLEDQTTVQTNEVFDSEDRPADPSLHKWKKDGSGPRTYWNKRLGRHCLQMLKGESGTKKRAVKDTRLEAHKKKMAQKVILDEQEEAERALRAAAKKSAAFVQVVAVSVLGKAGRFEVDEGYSEKQEIEEAFYDFYEAYGVSKFDPKLELALALGGFTYSAVKRAPEEKQEGLALRFGFFIQTVFIQTGKLFSFAYSSIKGVFYGAPTPSNHRQFDDREDNGSEGIPHTGIQEG